MNRKDLVKHVAKTMRDSGIRKPVSSPRKVFHISDDEGNKKNFTVKQTDKNVLFTVKDIDAVIDTCLQVICEALKRGEEVSIHGFGTLGLRYRKSRTAKIPGTDNLAKVEEGYSPKFTCGKDLKMCAKIYGLSLSDAILGETLPVCPAEDDGGGG